MMKKLILFLTIVCFPIFLSTTLAKYGSRSLLIENINIHFPKDYVFKGKISIRKMPQGWLSVAVKDNLLLDSWLFILQSDENYQVEEKETVGIVKYLSSAKKVEIEFESKKMTFALSNDNIDSENVPYTYYGYGLIKIRGSLESFAAYFDGGGEGGDFEKVQCECRKGGSTDKDCVSGGDGAKACSLDYTKTGGNSCSIDCSNQAKTFACCYEELN